MKIAIVHDWLVTNGGAEKVLSSILKLYPDAEVYTLVDFLNDEQRESILHGKATHTSFIQKLPFAKKHFRNYLPLFPKAIESFDLSKYDLVISSSWAVAKGAKTSKNQLHISYCYTPIRYAWDLYDEYTSQLKQPKKFIVQKTLKYIRKWDLQTTKNVDFFIADSKFVQERIKKTYRRDSTVIYPPVAIEKFALHKEKEDFYLTASRLVPYKKTRLIVEAFNQMPNKTLVVIGEGEEYESIKKIALPHIQILGYQTDTILIEKMQRAKAFVFAALEDFGIVVIEAMACGTPLIALNAGGTKETLLDGITGIYFNSQTTQEIIDAVTRFERLTFDPERIRTEAEKYTHFEKMFSTFISKKIQIQ